MAKKKVTAKSSQPAVTMAGGSAKLVEVGKPAPDFSLADQAGKPHKLSSFKGKWVVLYFYPKDDTSGCTKEACAFRDRHDDLLAAGAVVLGVSPDGVASHRKFVSKYNLPFALLADEEKKVCSLYGVWREKSMYGRKYMGVVRTTYLIDTKGVVARRWDQVSVTDHEKEVLAAVASA